MDFTPEVVPKPENLELASRVETFGVCEGLYLRDRTLEVTRETLIKIGQNIPKIFVARESLSLQII